MSFPHHLILALALLATSAMGATPAVARKPNVILILADDLGYRDLGCYGHQEIRTPVLDRLAGEGVRLTNFHSGAPVCTPSRMALLSGSYPVRLGWVRGVAGFKMGWRDGMSPETLTIAEIFQSADYATAISGKWHIGDITATRPPNQGFQSAFYLSHSNNQTKQFRRGDEVVDDAFDNSKLSEKFTIEAIRFIRENKERPFFLYLPFTAPHFPVEPHPEWRGRSSFGDYGDVVEELDFRIGEIITVLKELKIDQNTIMVFTSDNGPNPREQASPLPFRGEKWSALEGGTRVPCIVSWPGVIPAGQICESLTSAIDLLPTLCRASGIDWRIKSKSLPKMDGRDVWDSLMGKPGTHPRTELLHWHGMDTGPQAISVGDWKLFFDRQHALEGMGTERASAEQAEQLKKYRDNLRADSDNPPFLFNLRDDPGETTDLSERFPERVKELRVRADALVAEIKSGEILPISTPQ